MLVGGWVVIQGVASLYRGEPIRSGPVRYEDARKRASVVTAQGTNCPASALSAIRTLQHLRFRSRIELGLKRMECE